MSIRSCLSQPELRKLAKVLARFEPRSDRRQLQIIMLHRYFRAESDKIDIPTWARKQRRIFAAYLKARHPWQRLPRDLEPEPEGH